MSIPIFGGITMSSSKNINGFGISFRGYRRKDVNRYIELSDARHAAELSKLRSAIEELKKTVEKNKETEKQLLASVESEKAKCALSKSIAEHDAAALQERIASLETELKQCREELEKKAEQAEKIFAENDKIRRQLLDLTAETIILQKKLRSAEKDDTPSRAREKTTFGRLIGDLFDKDN